MKTELYVVYVEWPAGEEHSYWQKGQDEEDCLQKVMENHGYKSWDDFMENNGTEGCDFIRSIERDNFYYYFQNPIVADFGNDIPDWVKERYDENGELK